MPVVISRADAKDQRLRHYFTGQPCSRGHVDIRLVCDYVCLACKRERKRGDSQKRQNLTPEQRARYKKTYIEKNRDKYLAAKKRENSAEYSRRYRQKHPEVVRQIRANRRARITHAEGTHTAAELTALHDRQRGKCANCATSLKPGYHADHIVPLARGGTNWISNIQLLCPPCNQRKHAKDPFDFARAEGRLV